MGSAKPKISKKFVETDKGYVHVQETGEGRQSLVLLSITSFGGVLVDHVLPLLALRGYQALAIDLMGYGRSDKRDDVWLVENFADNIEQVLDRCNVTRFGLICGHFSSWMGIEMASRRRTGLLGMVLDGTPILSPETRRANLERGAGPATAWQEDGSHAREYWKRAYGIIKRLDPLMTLDPSPSRKFREAYIALLESLSFEPNTMSAANSFEVEKKLPLVSIPTLVMCGDHDWNLPYHAEILAAIPDSRELRLQGVHPLHELSKPERAGEYVEHIDQFFSMILQ